MNAYELADELETVYWQEGDGSVASCRFQSQANMLRQQAGELEYYKVRDSSHLKIIKQQANQIAELEKDLHMIQRHYDQLETFSPSGKNAQGVSNAKENLPKRNI